MTRFFRKHKWIALTLLVAICVGACALTAHITEGFTEYDPEVVFAKERNEENLMPAEYVSAQGNTGKGVHITVNNDGSITLDGKADADIVWDLATVKLEKGTYVLSGIKTASKSGAYIDARIGSSAVLCSDGTNPWMGDVSAQMTANITADSDVIFSLNIKAGTEFNNTKIYPCVNAGTTAADFYA